ncbi:MAG: hypothetical protein AAF483_09195 [Planctomycetota bacterium]
MRSIAQRILLLIVATPAVATESPNVVFVPAKALRQSDLGCFGAIYVIDRRYIVAAQRWISDGLFFRAFR